ncbi:MAG: protein-disulfide reductase DsbD family protein [Rhodobacter sp.]|nr:protein-disulfide reductase DsbD family protein [Rhodobacter sp.]
MLKSLVTAAAAALSIGGPTLAGGGFSPDDVAEFSILPGWRTESGTHLSALRVQLAPGWKTYWRAPGEAGIPPRFDWSGSRNISAVAFHWPVPEVFYQNGMRTVGYEHELVLPMELTPTRNGEAISVRAEVEIGVCQDICMPMSVRVTAELDPAGQRDSRIRGAMAARPSTEGEAGLKSVTCAIEPIRDGLRVRAEIDMPSLGGREVAVFEHPDQTIWVSEASARRQGRMLQAVTEMVPPSNAPFVLDRSQVRITVIGAGRAVDIWGCSG